MPTNPFALGDYYESKDQRHADDHEVRPIRRATDRALTDLFGQEVQQGHGDVVLPQAQQALGAAAAEATYGTDPGAIANFLRTLGEEDPNPQAP